MRFRLLAVALLAAIGVVATGCCSNLFSCCDRRPSLADWFDCYGCTGCNYSSTGCSHSPRGCDPGGVGGVGCADGVRSAL